MKTKKLAFCTAVKDRFGSLAATLPENISRLTDQCCISVVDYSSKSDSGEKWILSEFSGEIKSGRLSFFRVTDDLDWSAPRAKNLAHRLASAGYLFNLDSDNFISQEDVNVFLNVARKGIPCHQCVAQGPGTFGRIGLPSDTFYAIGGYDESMLPMGYQDADLLRRAVTYHGGCARLSWNYAPMPVDNEKSKLFSYGKSDSFYEEMNYFNSKRSALREELSGIVIKDSFASYRGRLNGTYLTVDGFGKLTLG